MTHATVSLDRKGLWLKQYLIFLASVADPKAATKGGKDKKGGKGTTKGATPNEPEVRT